MDKQTEFIKMVRIIEPLNPNGMKCPKVKSCKYICKEGEIFPCWDCKVATVLQEQGIGNVKQYQDEIERLKLQLEVSEQDKSNLQRTIEEMNETLSANGISIDCDGNVVDENSKQVVRKFADMLKETADDVAEIGIGHKHFVYTITNHTIDKLIKEVCGE